MATESYSKKKQERRRRKDVLLRNEHGHSRLSLHRAKCRIFYVSSLYQVKRVLLHMRMNE
jgi:hypothetical protein